MLQPIKKLYVRSLTVRGFKGFAEEKTFHFSDMNTITGHNGQGKSSIADAIAFAITGVPFFGGAKFDHLYNIGTKDIAVELEFLDEYGAVRRLFRRRVNDDMEIILDGQRITQRDLTLIFGERDIFLSIFNPRYFIDVLGTKGRDLLERYLPEIPKNTVMSSLNEHDRALLEGQDFLSAEALAKQLRAEIAQLERDKIYTQGQYDLQAAQIKERNTQLETKKARYAALTEEINALEARRTTSFDGTDLKEKLPELYDQYEELLRESPAGPELTEELDTQIQEAVQALEQVRARVYQSQYAQPLSDAQARIDALRKEVFRQKHILEGLKPGVKCHICRQTVTQSNLPEVQKEFEDSIKELCRQGCEQTAQIQELKGLDAKAKAVFEQFQKSDDDSGQAKLAELKERRRAVVENAQRQSGRRQQEIDRLHSEIQNTELDLECGLLSPEDAEHLNRNREEAALLSTEIQVLTAQAQEAAQAEPTDVLEQKQSQITEKKRLLAALTSYISKRVEPSFSSLQMNRVSIALYEVMKTTGEVKDVFKFTYEDRPYVCLSGSEKIRAGLEVSELIKGLTGVDYPVFIDDAERVPVIDNVRPSSQVFIAKVIKGLQLTVQAVSTTAPQAA